MSGLRYNENKTKWGLLSWPALKELTKVLEFGAQKYSAWNWTNGLSWSECFESLQRHAVSWYQGEDKDPETGLSHMTHVLCNAMFLVHFILFGTGKDDRPQALKLQKQGDLLKDAEERQAKITQQFLDALESNRVRRVQEDVCPTHDPDQFNPNRGMVGYYKSHPACD